MFAAVDRGLRQRAARHAALGDPIRLAIVDELAVSDRSPVELRRLVSIESNLLAHHLDVLESAGMIVRSQSSGDGRRRYVHLVRSTFAGLVPGRRMAPERALFVCTRNSARSQIAAALWRSIAGESADSAGTHPAGRVHPGAIAAARRAGLDLTGARPRALDDIAVLPRSSSPCATRPTRSSTPGHDWLHWSIADPVAERTRAAFDGALAELRDRSIAARERPGSNPMNDALHPSGPNSPSRSRPAPERFASTWHGDSWPRRWGPRC